MNLDTVFQLIIEKPTPLRNQPITLSVQFIEYPGEGGAAAGGFTPQITKIACALTGQPVSWLPELHQVYNALALLKWSASHDPTPPPPEELELLEHIMPTLRN